MATTSTIRGRSLGTFAMIASAAHEDSMMTESSDECCVIAETSSSFNLPTYHLDLSTLTDFSRTNSEQQSIHSIQTPSLASSSFDSSSFSETPTSTSTGLLSSTSSRLDDEGCDCDGAKLVPLTVPELSKRQRLKQKKMLIEHWHSQKKIENRATMAGMDRFYQIQHHPYSHNLSHQKSNVTRMPSIPSLKDDCDLSSSSTMPLTMNTVTRMDKEERQRSKRILQRLKQAEAYLSTRFFALAIRSDRLEIIDPKGSKQAWKERSETRLRLTQVEQAIQFFQKRVASNTTTGAVPLGVMKVVSSLPTIVPKSTLRDDLLHAFALLRDHHDVHELSAIVCELKVLSKGGLAVNTIQIGQRLPDFCLPSTVGKHLDSSKFLSSSTSRFSFLLVYWGRWSTLCMATLRTWQKHYGKMRNFGAHLVAIGMESETDSKATALKCGTKFPLLSDPQGLVIGQMGLVARNHPMSRLRESTTDALPMLSTIVVNGHGQVVYRYVSMDPTDRVEPIEVLQTVLTQEENHTNWGASKAPCNPDTNKRGQAIRQGLFRRFGPPTNTQHESI